MLNLRVAALLPAALALGLTTTPATAKPPGRAATCAAIAKEARALVTAAVKSAGVPTPADLILEAIAPIGTCIEPVVGGGQWALVLNDAPSLENQDIITYGPLDEDPEQAEITTPTTGIRSPTWTPVFVTADGRRIAPTGALRPLPDFDAFLDAGGNHVYPNWAFDLRTLDAFVRTAPNADGSYTAIFENSNWLVALVRFDGKSVIADPANDVLAQITSMKDLDKDGLEDLVDSNTLRVHMYGDGNYANAFDLIAMARKDGTFTTDHPFIAATYRKECEGLGRSPWMLGRAEASQIATNVACGRLFGVSPAVIRAGLDAEKASLTPKDDETTIEGFFLFDEMFGELDGILDLKLPSFAARTDGFTALPLASATSIATMKAFGVYRFDAGQATDGDLGTSWQPKTAKNAWIELKLDGPRPVAALDIANGFQRKDKLGDLFALNARVTRLQVVAGGKTFDLELDPTKRGYQRLDLPEVVTTDTIRIVLKASVKGSRWKDVAISEIVPLTR